MTRYVEIEPLTRKNFEEMLHEYENRTIGVFDEYYVHCLTGEKRDTSSHENKMTALYKENPVEYRNEVRRWGIVRDEWKRPALKMGTDRPCSALSIIDVTHEYVRHETRNGKLYAVIRMFDTPNASKYVDVPSNRLRILPIAYGRNIMFTLLKNKDNDTMR